MICKLRGTKIVPLENNKYNTNGLLKVANYGS